MAVEIERKFLVTGSAPMENGVEMVQGYLCYDTERTVRIRREGDRAVITVKGKRVGISRLEFESEIPLKDSELMMKLAVGPLVEKTRYYHKAGKHTWEIDVFKGGNAGLIVAEIELKFEDEEFEKPEWLGQEVSGDRKYSNSALSQSPFSSW